MINHLNKKKIFMEKNIFRDDLVYETSNDGILRWLYPYHEFHRGLVTGRDNHVDNRIVNPEISD
mgnify:CR=1 FL=1